MTATINACLVQQCALVCLVFCSVGCSVVTQAVDGQDRLDPATSLSEINEWQYHWGDAPVDTNGIPVWTYASMPADFWQPIETIELSDGHPPFAWIRTRLPDRLPGSAVLATDVVATSFEAYVDSMLIHRSGKLQPDPGNKYGFTTAQLIPLPDDAEGRMLYLRIYSEYPQFIGAHLPLLLATEGTILHTTFRNNLGQLVAGFIILVSGLISLLLSFKATDAQRTTMLLHLSVFSLCMGLYYLGSCFFISLILYTPVFWYYAVMSLVFFPVGMLGFLEHVVEPRFKRLIRRFWQVHLAFSCLLFLLDLTNLSIVQSWFMEFFLLLTVSITTSVVAVLQGIRSGRREAQIFGIGMLVILFFTFYDMVVLGFFADNPPVSQWGVLIFLLFLGYLLAHQFAEKTRQLTLYSSELEAQSEQLINANTRLEEYSHTLAQKVEERTMELAEKNVELTEKNQVLDTALQRLRKTQQQLVLQEKMASLGQLTAGIAHEIKNPLNFVNNFAELMGELMDELDDELHADLDDSGAGNTHQLFEILADLKSNAKQIAKHGKRADSIVSAMMQHASRGTGRRELTDVNTHLNEYVNLAYHGKRVHIEDFTCEIECDFDAQAGQVEIDRRELGRVFLNLLGNAFDAISLRKSDGEAGFEPRVRISTHRLKVDLDRDRSVSSADTIEIRIADNGPGIPKEFREKIFEPFFTTKPTGTNTGLGLSLSYDIVTQGHGGTLTVESEEGKGTTFIVTLPANSDADGW